MTAYAELQVTSNFSFLRGGAHPEELVLRAKELGLEALALTDRNTLAGVVRAHCAAKEVGIRFVVGARLDLAGEEAPQRSRVLAWPGACAPRPGGLTPHPDPPPQGGRENIGALPGSSQTSSQAGRENGGGVAEKSSGFSLQGGRNIVALERKGREVGAPSPLTGEGGVGVARAAGTAGEPRSLLCFPTDRAAYGRLSQLISLGQLRADKGKCRLWLEDLFEHAEGLIVVALPPARIDDAFEAFLETLGQRLPGAYLAAQQVYRGDDAARLEALAGLALRCRMPLVATGDVLYHVPERRPLQDVLSCIREHTTIDEAGYRLAANAERHLKPPAEVARLFRDHPDALARSLEIVEACRFSLDELRYDYPIDPAPAGLTVQQHLEQLTWQGAAERYPEGVPDKVRDLLAHEFALIAELGYAPYFLTVHDIVRYAREQRILCQGRGSAANSAVCFCLGITEVDPGRFDLLFERFVSAERKEPPDIDVDFEHERREEVIQYIYRKYGRAHAGIAATVIHYRARSAIREVGKALGLSEDAAGALASGIWGWSDGGLDEGLARERGLDPAEPRLRLALQLAAELTGFPRHLSQHVGGFVLTRSRLDQVVPVLNAAMPERTFVEWDKDDLDALGILKIDVLALGMLTCIRKAFALIERHYGRTLTMATLPAEDPAVYEMLGRADSLGVFQVESRAQMTMLPRLKPRCFYDLIIEVAIVRPGPIQGDMVHPYLRRRAGIEPVAYPSAALKGVLEKTLGVPLFQEQAMQIAIVGAGFTPSEADRLRRAMATFKRVGTIHTFRDKFIDGMARNGYERAFAERCFQQIEGFGTYGFPESHAASFALLVYVSSWLKRHYPEVFACALLNSQPMGFYAPAQIVRDAQGHGVAVLPVDVNASDWDGTLEMAAATAPPPLPSPVEGEGVEPAPAFPALSPVLPGSFGAAEKADATDRPHLSPPLPGNVGASEKTSAARRPCLPPPLRGRVGVRGERRPCALRLGFRQVKGLKEEEMRRLVAARGQGYADLADLRRRAGIGAGALDRLARADGFGSLALDRRGALWRALGLDRSGHELDLPPLFAWAKGQTAPAEPAVALPPMTLGHEVAEDYVNLRLSLRAHPLALLRPRLPRRILPAAQLAAIDDGRRVEVAGLVLVRQRPGTASGVIFITLEDETGVANLVVWPKLFERFRRVVLGAQLMVVQGPVQKEGLVIHVVAERLLDRSDLLRRLAETDQESAAPLARDDRVKPDRGRRRSPATPAASAPPPFQVPLAHADHVKSSGPHDPRDPGAGRREQALLEPFRARQATPAPPLARADEAQRPARDPRAPPHQVAGFRSRDFH